MTRETFIKNGAVYHRDTYENGLVIEYLYKEPSPDSPSGGDDLAVPVPELPDIGVVTLEGVAALSEQLTAVAAEVAQAKADAETAKNASLAALEGIAAIAEVQMTNGGETP